MPSPPSRPRSAPPRASWSTDALPLVVLARVGAAVLGRPRLWVAALRQWRRLVPAGWWRRPPFVPLPPRSYLRFRFVTAYGGEGAPTGPSAAVDPAADLVSYLEWCRAWPAVAGASHRRP